MPQFTARHIEDDTVGNLSPIRVGWQEHEFGRLVDESSDEPRASHSINLHFFACNPFHNSPASINSSLRLSRPREPSFRTGGIPETERLPLSPYSGATWMVPFG